MATHDIETRYIVASALLTSELPNECVILDTAKGDYYGLNHVGTFIWQTLRHGATQSELVDAVISQFDVAPGQCEHDVSSVLEQFLACGLIVPLS